MVKMQIVKKLNKKQGIINSQAGFTLIEAVIGVGLLVIVGVAVLTGVSTAFKASATTDKISNALALAQSQIEYMQTQPYVCATNGNAAYQRIAGDAAQALSNNYSISSIYLVGGVETEWTSASSDPPIVYAVAIDKNGAVVTSGDTGLQRITIIIHQGNNQNPLTLVAYKVKQTTGVCP